MSRPTAPIVIVMEGGMITGVYCTGEIAQPIVVIDYDDENLDETEVESVPQGKDHEPATAYVSELVVDRTPFDHIDEFVRDWLARQHDPDQWPGHASASTS